MTIRAYFLSLTVLASAVACGQAGKSDLHSKGEPWNESQLIAPADLAQLLSDSTRSGELPVIFSIGPSGLIKHANDIGSTGDSASLDMLRVELSKLHRDREIVIYCGCCPFSKCLNIRPAFLLLNGLGFTHHKLLNLPVNLKTDWIDKSYPMH